MKRYGDIVAVNGVSFRVKYGEIFGFLGPNGAGKTTTIHILSTLLKPTAGRALVAGYDVVREAASVRRSIGIVFQDPSLDEGLTAYENLYIHGRVYGLRGSALRERIEEMLGFVELEEYRDRLVRTFSGGMRRRLELARALLHEPRVLFLDEPTLGLDPHARTRLWEYIARLRAEKGVTIFLTTHYMEEAEQLCDRIAIIDKGRIVATGSPDELKSMLGDEVVYMRVSDPGKACKALERLESVKECKVLQGGRVSIHVPSAAQTIPELLEAAKNSGVRVVEVSYRRPTLNDVFIHLTGRGIEEESVDETERIRIYARSYFRRKG